jgi:hypothetical protein
MYARIPVQLGWRAPSKGVVLPVGPVQRWEPAKLPVSLGQTGGEIKATILGIMTLPTLIAAATTYVGFRLGKKDHGIPSILGYAVGTVGALATLGSLLIMAGVLKAPIPDRPTSSSGPIVQPV